MAHKVAPYGSWKSPVTSELIVSETIGLERAVHIALDGKNTYWTEMRQAEGGRYVIVRRSPDGEITDLIPPPFNTRTRVHETGRGHFVVTEGTVCFSNFTDQRLYLQVPGAKPQPITPEAELRYAEGIIDHQQKRIICVREDHTDTGGEVVHTLASISLDGSNAGDGGQVLVSGNDFYASPQFSPDGSQLAWLTWNHLNMAEDRSELWIGTIGEDGLLSRTERVVDAVDESISQPKYSPDGTLYFISDRTGWGNLYRWHNRQIELLYEMEAEFGARQGPTYAFESLGRIICSYSQRGICYLASLDTATGELKTIETPYTTIEFLQVASGRAVFLAGSPTELPSIVQLDLATGKLEVLRRTSEVTIDSEYLSIPQAIEFPTEHGLTAHAFFYKPKNGDYVAPPDERPPLLVVCHGGLGGATSNTLNLMIQYWNSRGFALVDVNYGGSTGFGREYRQRLKGQWGVVDLDDCVNSARYLVERGEADVERLVIRGGSAGGYTTLCALTFRNVFKAGASYYGPCDLETIRNNAIKIGAHFEDWLIGPYPERRDLYQERSPINFAERISYPVIVFQGLEDKIILPKQAEKMVKTLRAKGLPVTYVPFKDEGHGFRRAKNIKRALDAELYFYSKVFGFQLADPVEPVPIDNL